jgi:phosphohistidine phosphatase
MNEGFLQPNLSAYSIQTNGQAESSVDFYLVRHGEAVAQGADGQRPLTPAGRQGVARVAQAAAARSITISEIVHSGILRAQETADILAEYLSPPNGVRAMDGLSPQDDPVFVKAELEGAQHPLMLVGHLPYMGRLAGLLASGDPDRAVVEFQPATLVCFSRDLSGWKISWSVSS